MRPFSIAACAALPLALVLPLACGGSDSGTPSAPATPVVPVAKGVTSISVTHGGDSLDVGAKLQLAATVRDAQGGIITDKTVTWTATDRNIIDLSADGIVTGLMPGTVSVTASIGDVKGVAALRIRVQAAAKYTVDSIGRVLDATAIGAIPGNNTGTADASAIELPDKRTRIYFAKLDGSGVLGHIASAISSDGIHFTTEPGNREPPNATPQEGFGSPLVFALPSGGYRLFYNGCHAGHCGLESATSVDGLTMVADGAVGLPAQSTIDQPACGGIVRLADGRYRAYCSEVFSASPAPAGTSGIYSATSADLLNWTVDAGRRIGPGAPTITGDARHPTAIANADGSVSLLYYSRRAGSAGPRLFISHSTDGLTFTADYDMGFTSTEPSVVKRADGSIWVYYGNQTPTTGSTIAAARLTPIVR